MRKKSRKKQKRRKTKMPWNYRRPPVCAPSSGQRLHDGCTHTCPSGCSLPPEGCAYSRLKEAWENRCALCRDCTQGLKKDRTCTVCGRNAQPDCSREGSVENPWA